MILLTNVVINFVIFVVAFRTYLVIFIAFDHRVSIFTVIGFRGVRSWTVFRPSCSPKISTKMSGTEKSGTCHINGNLFKFCLSGITVN